MIAGSRNDDEITAIRDSVLAAHERTLATFPLWPTRLDIRLRKIKLSWLMTPLMALVMLSRLPRMMKPQVELDEAVRRCVEATGKSREACKAEMDRIKRQLMHLDARAPFWDAPELSSEKPARPAEIRTTAGALLEHALSDRPTKDPLLADMLVAYEDLEELLKQDAGEGIRSFRLDGGKGPAQDIRERYEAHRLYVRAWRRWFSQGQK